MNTNEVNAYKKYLDELLSLTNISETNINIWCDIIELLCFTNADKIIYKEDIERNIEMQVDGGIQLESFKDLSVQMKFDIPDSRIFSNHGSIDWGSDDAPKADLLNQITNIWFTHLEQRRTFFGDSYPFKIKSDRSEISSKKVTELTKANKLYLSFLITSNRGGLNLSRQRRLEFDFEPISFNAFLSLIPVGGAAHLMGKGRYTATKFKKNKFTKFKLLSDILKTKIKVKESHFSPKDSGENGIDFIGWFKFNDELPNNYVFAGQATCMKDWEGKEYESSKERAISGILDPTRIGGYINSLYIPYHFKVGTNWADSTIIEGRNYILFDRFRILTNLNINNIHNSLIPHEIITAIG